VWTLRYWTFGVALLGAGACLEQNPDWDLPAQDTVSASTEASGEATQDGTADGSSEGADATMSGGDGDADTTGGDGDSDTTGGGEVVVLVVGDTSLTEAVDVDVHALLEDMGYAVQLVGSLEPEWMESAALILINETAVSANLATKYRHNPNPVLSMEGETWSALRLSTGSPTAPMLTNVDIANETHPMAAGYSGTTPLMEDFGILVVEEEMLGATAQIVARGEGISGVAIFGYETGDEMTNSLAAPARRSGIGITVGDGETTSFVDPEGLELVRAAVAWTAGATP
jgi:hypothetical protein